VTKRTDSGEVCKFPDSRRHPRASYSVDETRKANRVDPMNVGGHISGRRDAEIGCSPLCWLVVAASWYRSARVACACGSSPPEKGGWKVGTRRETSVIYVRENKLRCAHAPSFHPSFRPSFHPSCLLSAMFVQPRTNRLSSTARDQCAMD